MTTDHNTRPPGPPPGYYRAVDGNDYPIPPGHVLGADGQLYPVQGPPPPPVRSSTWEWNLTSVLTVAGAAAVFIGAFLPWASIGAFSAAGTDGDGVITLVLAIGAGGLGAAGLSKANAGLLVGSLICAALIFLIGAYDMANISAFADAPFGLEPRIGGGLYLTVVGAVAGLVSAVLALRNHTKKAF